ncbi:hypothetical protein LINPERHAP1_LOCUS30204 [Linum perenne]|jgi:hypothetical protein
MHT